MYIEKLPIPIIPFDQQKPFIDLVDELLNINIQLGVIKNFLKSLII